MRARPGNRRHVKARTIECCRTLSRTNHVLVTYPQRRPERGAGPKSTLAGILSVDLCPQTDLWRSSTGKGYQSGFGSHFEKQAIEIPITGTSTE